MKCYDHPKTDAVGVCSQCGKGICSKCAVEIGGKLYCKPDADKAFGSKPQTATAPAASEAPQKSSSAMKNSTLGMSSFAWMLAILGVFFFPPICWGLGTIMGYIAVSKASENLNVFSKRDVIVCGIGAIANIALLVWWGIGIIDLL
jgi:hypothetical protein